MGGVQLEFEDNLKFRVWGNLLVLSHVSMGKSCESIFLLPCCSRPW